MAKAQINRNRDLQVPLSQEELDVVKREALRLGVPTTTFIRLLIKNWVDGVVFTRKSEPKDGS